MVQGEVVIKKLLERKDVDQIQLLETVCSKYEKIAFKLELDFKWEYAKVNENRIHEISDKNEFLFYNTDDSTLIGYLGIMRSPGRSPEIMGLVHPNYRKQGVFSQLVQRAFLELKESNTLPILLLCDKYATTGQHFIRQYLSPATLHHTEYEMHLNWAIFESSWSKNQSRAQELTLYPAKKSDAYEINIQNAEYFGMPIHDMPLMDPEVLVQTGMHVYLAVVDAEVVGKVHLQLIEGQGAIYGLGIKSDFRGKGLGKALLLNSVEQLKTLGAIKILLQVESKNDQALQLYIQSGFEQDSVMDYYELASVNAYVKG